ncbi:hypothetical protein EDB85DRAFT_2157321 [Lactarius pseudohatsudake]|nr:hypothetical protein EDB85DRAFT_2157321 [Lactarius pseudohatsudake]
MEGETAILDEVEDPLAEVARMRCVGKCLVKMEVQDTDHRGDASPKNDIKSFVFGPVKGPVSGSQRISSRTCCHLGAPLTQVLKHCVNNAASFCVNGTIDKAPTLHSTTLSEVLLSAPCPSIPTVHAGLGVKTLTIFDAWSSHESSGSPSATSNISASTTASTLIPAIASGAMSSLGVMLTAIAHAAVTLADVTLTHITFAAVSLMRVVPAPALLVCVMLAAIALAVASLVCVMLVVASLVHVVLAAIALAGASLVHIVLAAVTLALVLGKFSLVQFGPFWAKPETEPFNFHQTEPKLDPNQFKPFQTIPNRFKPIKNKCLKLVLNRFSLVQFGSNLVQTT